MTFSLCMIVKNEENTLKRCLDSVMDVFDEIIIVDTGSIDSTKNIAYQYTDKVFDFMWCDDFSAARNFSFSKAKSDYIMWLDADDVLEEKDRKALLSLKHNIKPDTDVVMMKYATAFDSQGKPSFLYYRERLIKRLKGMMWNGFVHEVITPRGNVIYENITVSHKQEKGRRSDPMRNLKIYEGQIAKGVKLSARETYYYARELYYNGRRDSAAKYLEQFLSFPNGWYADKVGACLILYDIYKSTFPIKAKDFLVKALSYDTASPQVLCFMGDEQKKAGRLGQAIFWYTAALMCPAEYSESGFVLPEYERYYPLLQLCVCYDMKGEHERAREYNRLAGLEKPDSEQVKYNERYFESFMEKMQEETDEENP